MPENDLESVKLPKTLIPQKSNYVEQYHININNYSIQKASDILQDIASDNTIPIEKIAERHNVPYKELRLWVFINDNFSQAYFYAKSQRVDSKIEHWEQKALDIMDNIDSAVDSLEVRKMDTKVRLLRVMSLNEQWEASKLNPKYKDKQEIEHTGIDPIAARIEAWNKIQEAKETTYKEIKDNVTDESKQDT